MTATPCLDRSMNSTHKRGVSLKLPGKINKVEGHKQLEQPYFEKKSYESYKVPLFASQVSLIVHFEGKPTIVV